MEVLKILLDFISGNIWPLLLLVFLIIARKAIAGVLDRLSRLSFSWGDASGNVEVAVPSQPPIERREAPPLEKSEASSSVPEAVEIEDKKKEAGDWFPEMHLAFLRRDVDSARRIFEAQQRMEHDPDERHASEAVFLHFLFTDGNDQTALKRLEELHARSANDKQRVNSAGWLGWAHEAAKDFASAERVWRHTLSAIRSEPDRTRLSINLAYTYRNQKDFEKAIDLLETRLSEVGDTEQRLPLYQALASLEKEKGNTESAAIALEKVVELSPADRDKLFEAAHAQSEAKLTLLGTVHYDTLLNLDPRNSAALNNLGVSANELTLPGKEIALYRRAMDQGNTLSMANLANAFARAGFWDEAKNILDTARKTDNPHENVGNAIYRLRTAQEEEDKKWTQLQNRAEKLQLLIRRYGEALFDKTGDSLSFAGSWFNDQGDEIVVEGDKEFKAHWTEKGALTFLPSPASKCSITGTRRHRSASLTYHRQSAGERRPSLLFGSVDKTIKCYSYLTSDGITWEIFSIDPNEELTLSLRRNLS